MNEINKSKLQGLNIMKLGMIACCTVMLLPIISMLSTGLGLGGFRNNSAVFLPLVICLGFHVVMRKMMGKSCHGDHSEHEPNRDKDIHPSSDLGIGR